MEDIVDYEVQAVMDLGTDYWQNLILTVESSNGIGVYDAIKSIVSRLTQGKPISHKQANCLMNFKNRFAK